MKNDTIPKISVIMPVLNAEKYIEDAIDSVLEQTIINIELLCIDAGSSDGTVEKIEGYVLKDDRVKLIKSPRKSYGYQMNLGVDYARGEYIGIVEADDYVPNNMYEELYEIAHEKELDIIKADFYRFTGRKGYERKIYFPLTDKTYLYRKVFEPKKEQISLLSVNNTWSGIYRRKFIVSNKIRHNESSGAAFQDNGFFFQTFAYAKRVFLYNKPYYMNRRDNPGSSVFDKNKVYCICEEYKYIYELLKERDLFETYRDIFMVRMYCEYCGNLGRIQSKDKLEFLNRFSTDFLRLKSIGELDTSTFEESMASELKEIMKSPIEYWEKHIKPVDLVFDKIEEYNKIIIFGAASVGWVTLVNLLGRGKASSILCFAVSKIREVGETVYGYEVKQIDTLTDEIEDCVLVIAAKEKFRNEMRKKAEYLKFRNIIEVPSV